jgi:hypothetical protein
MKLRLHHLLAAACLPAFAFQTSCTTPQQQGAVIGGLAGAALGGIAGYDSDDVLLGAALGAGAGAGVAAMGEDAARRNAGAPYGTPQPPRSPYAPRYDNRRPSSPAPNPAPAPPRRQEYPVARRTSNPDQVISPYAPYNVIDVKGFKHGALARDPSNKKIFRVP